MMRHRVILLALLAASGSASAERDTPPQLNWQPCGNNAECTQIPVPLDWQHPRGEQITLAFTRHRASDPTRRVGALVFINGMGASGMDYVAQRIGAGRFPADLTASFDVIGVDPRGGGVNPSGARLNLPVQSTSLDCQLAPHTADTRYFPESRAELERLEAHNRNFAQSCGRLAGHTDAASHAHDLEAVRRALGEDKLSLMTWTTGNFVGLIYAKLFPKRVRALALDQPFDASVPPLQFLAEHALAIQDQFARFEAWCDRTEACALHAEDVGAALSELVAQANSTPIPATGPTPPPADEGAAIDHPLNGDEFLLMIEQLLEIGDIEVAPGLTGFDAIAYGIYEARFGSTSVFPGSFMYSAGWPGFWSRHRVNACTDFRFGAQRPAQFAAVKALMRLLAPDMRGMSQAWDFYTGCTGWPLAGKATVAPNKFDKALPPVLVISSRHSAYAPYSHAKRISRNLPRGRLLTYEGDTHIVFLSSECAKQKLSAYLIDGALPPVGASCPQEGLLVESP